MATTSDIRDIMDMGHDGPKPPAPKKKKKIVEAQPRLSGISREVQALMGDSVPPVAIVETPKYKSKPSLAYKMFKPRHWEERSFQHGARADGLTLKHWKRANPGKTMAPGKENSEDVEMQDGDIDAPAPATMGYAFEDEYPMDKWNVKVNVPSYTDEQYELHHKSDEWSKEETDYLLQLVQTYDLRWILVADRYDPKDISDGTKEYPDRNVEALKTRYYHIAARELEMRTPASNMTTVEFALWEKMKNFDAKTEGLRKSMAEKLFERTKDEAEEEKTLLEELSRITKNEEDFIAQRRDLYARLEAAPSLRRNERGEEQNIVLSSAGLSDLLQRLFAKEKHLKKRLPPGAEAGAHAAHAAVDQKGRQVSQASRRETADSHAGDVAAQKKGSTSNPVPKQLTPAEEAKYGVIRPTERLTSGVMFRHEKINRITTAKSQVQTQKINAALTELEIPPRLSMPTEKVCKKFEQLVNNIQLLLDARKTLTRVTEEVKTLEEMKRIRLGLPKEPEAANENGTAKADPIENASSAADTTVKNDTDTQAGPEIDESQVADASMADETKNEEDDEEDEDDDAEAEDEDTQMAQPRADQDDEDDEDDDDNDNGNDESRVQGDDDEDDAEDDDEQDEEDVDAEEEEDEDDEDISALQARMKQDEDNEDEDEDEEDEDEDGDEDAEEEEAEDDAVDETQLTNGADGSDAEENEEDEEEDEEADESKEDVANSHNDDGEDAEEEPEEEVEKEPSRPGSSGPAVARLHKRSASVISDASKAGSNRSLSGRKRRR